MRDFKKMKKNSDLLNEEEKSKSSRRTFLKKAAYSAPVLVGMGQLVKPTNVHADSTIASPPGSGKSTGWNP
jgi:hypothetical protein